MVPPMVSGDRRHLPDRRRLIDRRSGVDRPASEERRRRGDEVKIERRRAAGSGVGGDAPVWPGDEYSLGETGTRLRVAAVAEALGETAAELPSLPAGRPPEARAYAVTLLAAGTGKRYEARGTRIRIGRGQECDIRPVDAADTIGSRVHAELAVGPGCGLA